MKVQGSKDIGLEISGLGLGIFGLRVGVLASRFRV